MSRWQTANVLQTTPGLSRLWRLNASGEEFAFDQEQSCLPSEPLNGAWIAKDFRSTFRHKLNLAWLPPDKAFLRVLHLPASEPSELIPMVEFQLEKLSPLPVAQIVWSVELLPRPAGKPDAMQTVVVVIASRAYVEEFLAGAEAKGFKTDALELPSLDQLLNTKIEGNGVWLYVGPGAEPALAAWWYGGELRHLALVPLAEGEDREKHFLAQLQQVAWAGELDGWLTEAPRVHLIAAPAEAAIWEPIVRQWVGESYKISAPIDAKDLAARSAARAARAEAHSNLLPPESAKRYRQQFIDGLWLRGGLTVFGAYAFGVIVYLTALFVMKSQCVELETQVHDLGGSYTNALINRDRLKIIQERQELKYAALDCWKAVAKTMPESLTLEEMYFQRGKLTLNGTAPLEKQFDITSFHQALSQETVENESLFSEVSAPSINSRGTAQAVWKLSCTLKGGEELK